MQINLEIKDSNIKNIYKHKEIELNKNANKNKNEEIEKEYGI